VDKVDDAVIDIGLCEMRKSSQKLVYCKIGQYCDQDKQEKRDECIDRGQGRYFQGFDKGRHCTYIKTGKRVMSTGNIRGLNLSVSADDPARMHEAILYGIVKA